MAGRKSSTSTTKVGGRGRKRDKVIVGANDVTKAKSKSSKKK